MVLRAPRPRSFAPNGYGLYNTVGNMRQWTADRFRAKSAIQGRTTDKQDINAHAQGSSRAGPSYATQAVVFDTALGLANLTCQMQPKGT